MLILGSIVQMNLIKFFFSVKRKIKIYYTTISMYYNTNTNESIPNPALPNKFHTQRKILLVEPSMGVFCQSITPRTPLSNFQFNPETGKSFACKSWLEAHGKIHAGIRCINTGPTISAMEVWQNWFQSKALLIFGFNV